MPHVIELADDAVLGLAEAADALAAGCFDPADPDNLAHHARLLRRLGNNRDFLGDLMVAELAARHRAEPYDDAYGPQAIVLARPHGANCFLRANIWPGPADHMMRASGGDAFVYGMPHDHNFSFLTLGYFGPGYWSDYYEFDYDAVAGWRGEPVALRSTGRHRLDPGKLQLYRAHVDVHTQLPAEALSVSVNIMHSHGSQAWLDQYRFDPDKGEIGAILSNGASEAFLRIAVGLAAPEAIDLAERFARTHPSDRMRLHALDALASVADGPAARDALWARAENAGSRLVAMEAKTRRRALAA
ncbi:MAG: transposase [Sphingomonadales bacterium]|nr:transposase [Sphingomonadales bacterium]